MCALVFDAECVLVYPQLHLQGTATALRVCFNGKGQEQQDSTGTLVAGVCSSTPQKLEQNPTSRQPTEGATGVAEHGELLDNLRSLHRS